MSTRLATTGGFRRAAVTGVLLFWVFALVAGAIAPGYSLRDDYTSSLAGRGSEVALLGVAALAVLGLAHLAAAAVVRSAAVPLAVAGAFGLLTAAFRTSCPAGAAGCGSGANDVPPDLADAVHGLAVIGYEIALLVAMGCVAVGALRGGPPKWLGAVSLLAAIASVLLVLQLGGADNGWWQRAWLVVNTGWLVLVVVLSRDDARMSGLGSDPTPDRREREGR